VIVGLGTDLCRISRIAKALERWAERFERRVFTAAEREYCQARPATRAVHFAARFAAKEAAFKALGTGMAQGVRWKDAEVTRAPGEPPRLQLSGRAAEIARSQSVENVHLSLTHDGDFALAVVVLEGSLNPEK